MKEYSKEIFEDFYDEDSSEVFEDLIFNSCEFKYCHISQTENPFYRSTVRNVLLNNCVITRGSLGCVILEDITIENLRNNGLIQTWGAVFKHIMLKGRIGNIMITTEYESVNKEIKHAFNEENRQFYQNTDWALDISKAECIELDIRGIPSDLIKIDPETQGVIRKENIPANWEKIEFNDRITSIIISHILRFKSRDKIYVAPKRDKKHFNNMMKDLKMMRELGIADQIV